MARLDLANARIGARRSRLLGAEGLRELLVRPSLAARVELLVRTGRLAASAEPPNLPQVEHALRAGVRADEERLLGEVEGARPRRLLQAALGFQEAQALKVLLRGIAHGLPPDRLLTALAEVASLSEERLRRLVGAASVEAVAEHLIAEGSPFGPPVRAALGERDRGGLLPVELAIDRLAFARLGAVCRRTGEDGEALRAWLGERADLRNATTLLLLADAATQHDLYLEGGGRMERAAFQRLARAPARARREAVAPIVPCDPAELAEPIGAERLLERAALRRLTRAARQRPLSLAVPLAWLEARREEVRRIALVLRGAALGLPGDAILEWVEA